MIGILTYEKQPALWFFFLCHNTLNTWVYLITRNCSLLDKSLPPVSLHWPQFLAIWLFQISSHTIFEYLIYSLYFNLFLPKWIICCIFFIRSLRRVVYVNLCLLIVWVIGKIEHVKLLYRLLGPFIRKLPLNYEFRLLTAVLTLESYLVQNIN